VVRFAANSTLVSPNDKMANGGTQLAAAQAPQSMEESFEKLEIGEMLGLYGTEDDDEEDPDE